MLRAFARLAAEHSFVHFEGVGDLPHFNPDNDREESPIPSEVVELRKAVVAADVLLLSTPEYAHGLPGSFKNALDWLVSEPGFQGKPVVILSADRGSKWAFESLKEILHTMSAVVIDAACAFLPLGSNRIDDEMILGDANLRRLLETSVQATRNFIHNLPRQP